MSVQLSPERQEADLAPPVACICRRHKHAWECDTYPQECQAYCDGAWLWGELLAEDECQACVVCVDMYMTENH